MLAGINNIYMIEKKLKIVCLGFDWNDIAFKNIEFTKSKLDRDGLNPCGNSFLLLYGGNKYKRQGIRKEPLFITWHFNFFCRLRIFYDLLFVFVLPFVLIYEKFKPDIFYLTDFPHILSAVIPAKCCGSRIFFRLVNLPTELALTKGRKGKIFYVYYKVMEKITIPLVARFIVINETTKKYLIERGVKEEKIIFDIPNTIARDRQYIESADKEYIRRKYNISSGKKIILSVGSLLPEKGFVELIETFAKLKREDLVLIICGAGKDEQKLKELSIKLRVAEKIIFAGFAGREKIWNYYFGADLFMLFSKSESLGLVFWEAMYAGLPVIGTPVGGVAESIGEDGERGFYWRRNMDDLENKINICLSEIDEKKSMVARAKNYVEEKLKMKITINQIYAK